mmetsp:Transcript_20616/g.30989  ORF Transcript_20616/g.30989 Transcript_20616/m.30989 type:complete len:324 (-) Transcript_20616:17-988(-)
MNRYIFITGTQLLCILQAFTSAFVSVNNNKQITSRLFGISEWGEFPNGVPSVIDPVSPLSSSIRNIPLVLRNSKQVSLPGELKYLQLTTNEEIRAFQKAVDRHQSILGLGLCTVEMEEDDIIHETVAVLEIQDYNLMGDQFGVFLKAQVVGRATMLEILDINDNDRNPRPSSQLVQTNCVMARCQGKFDHSLYADDDEKLKKANQIADMIESSICDTSDVEQSILQNGNIDDDVTSRLKRFQSAYTLALQQQQDCRNENGHPKQQRSWSELYAISWAAFATAENVETDAFYRLQAMDMDCLLNRLKLAMYWLNDIRFEVESAV